ncbi:MAG: hypothetical protein HOC27_09045 [Phycisphaerae bacterium]|nr:hypothetical protein [Phycisphaerae bacterium]
MKNIFFYTFTSLFATVLVSCQNPSGDPSLASPIYPMNLHVAESVPIQVLRQGEVIEIVNSTADDYGNTTLWVNQRFSAPLSHISAGSTYRFDLHNLRDAYGEQFNAGGIWRTDEQTKLIIAELQIDEVNPLVGLVVINGD